MLRHDGEMARVLILLFLIQVGLAAFALISCLSVETGETGKIRALPRPAWVLIILFVPLIGAIAWFVAGRPVPAGPQGAGRTGGPAPRRTGPVAPDDNPDFLRSLDDRSDQDRELFDRWESDLRRREDDLRQRQAGDPPREEDRPEV